MDDLSRVHSEVTLPMSVANTGFMLDRLGQDCAPLQFLRELTQNSIEAVLDTGNAGEVVWDVDWNRHTLTGQYKLACIDTGIGMTGPEMVQYINALSSSVRQQSLEGNFGVGAKIAAATRNHAGLVYLSWKDGVGAMVHLWRDPDSGVYGLRQFELPDGSYAHFAPISDDIKPDGIEEHGTMVVLLGDSEDQDTMKAPPNTPSPSRWVQRYLNTRYFRFPRGVTIRARAGWEAPRSNTDTNLLATLVGQEKYLERHKQCSGSKELSNAIAHWWILKDEDALSQNSGLIASSGHVGALYQNELYEMLSGRAGVARLQLFGVIFGYQRVVIYVEPQGKCTPNTARTHLSLDQEPLPWAEWAAEFRSDLPEEIGELMEEVTRGTSAENHKEAIKERLRQIRDLFKVSRYRPTPQGGVLVAEDETVTGGKPKAGDNEKGKSGTSGRRGGRAGDIYALFLSSTGQPGTEVNPFLNEPRVEWVSVENGKRTTPFLEDRAADYQVQLNLLQINGDFRVFTDFVDRWAERYSDVPGARDVVRDTVAEWWEQTLIEAVLGVQALQGAKEWTVESIGRALSQEALTSAVMPRYHTEMAVRRALGSKLGSLREKGEPILIRNK